MDYANSSGWPLAPASARAHDDTDQHQADADLLERIQLETDAATLAHVEPASPPKRLRLTPSQQAIHNQILLDVADPSVRSVGLFGNAGVGKTVTTGAIVRSLQLEYGSGVTLCATTHKAARQVEKAMASLGIPDPACITIHRLLGVRQVRDHNTGEEYFTADKNDPPILDETIRVVILDEASMLPQQLYHLLLDATGLFQTLVFVGDDRQLPPVSDGKLCPAFSEAAR